MPGSRFKARLARLSSLSFLFISACGSDAGAYFGGGFSPPPSVATQDAGTLEVPEGTYWLQLSADDSTSMASAQLARLGYVLDLHRHEFINYYDPAVSLSGEESWNVEAQLTSSIWLGAKLVMHEPTDEGQTGDLLLQLRADEVAPATRRPWHLVYCVDVSGWMAGAKLDFVKAALLRSLDHLREGDHVSLVAFDDRVYTHLTFLPWPDKQSAVESAFESLSDGGGTDMLSGLDRAYEIAQDHVAPAHLTRVLLFGDGAANVGETDVARFASLTRI